MSNFTISTNYSIFEIEFIINYMIDTKINDDFMRVPAENMGLDSRCGNLYTDGQCIAVKKSFVGSLEYYGGFEYIEKDYVRDLGDYRFYSNDDERVMGALNHLESLGN